MGSGYGLVTATEMVPTLVEVGLMTILYVPVVGSVCVAMLNAVLDEEVLVTVEPSGFNRLTSTVPIVLSVNRTVTCCPAVPVNVAAAFWPGVVVVNDVNDPPTVSEPRGSAGTSYSVRLTDPVFAAGGSKRIGRLLDRQRLPIWRDQVAFRVPNQFEFIQPVVLILMQQH